MYLFGEIIKKKIRKMKTKCNKCIKKPRKECCNNCKEVEYLIMYVKNMVKVKD